MYEPLSYSNEPSVNELCQKINSLSKDNKTVLDKRCNEVSLVGNFCTF